MFLPGSGKNRKNAAAAENGFPGYEVYTENCTKQEYWPSLCSAVQHDSPMVVVVCLVSWPALGGNNTPLCHIRHGSCLFRLSVMMVGSKGKDRCHKNDYGECLNVNHAAPVIPGSLMLEISANDSITINSTLKQ